ncbi:uncharacterized protein LAJ45_09459 [Morchella importuna]|uniref:uncharacterized protein n=1 Tax=Morchella importuna TaxID=1174673 RepID=UPI001E8ECBD9|nr:uncharacterized protein LAJ45_09459 [Morchella importuna]KAH8146513.1 hypothetical protein LAJ45_09459 [Morchella importuna]
MNKYSLRPRVEGSGTKGSLDNGDIIAIVGIFASIIATLFSVWLLYMLHKRYGGSIGAQERSAEILEDNGNQVLEPSSTSGNSLQDLVASSIQSAQFPATGTRSSQWHGSMLISAPVENGSSSRLREVLEHPLEVGITRPERAHTWAADKTKHWNGSEVGTSYRCDGNTPVS